MKITIDDPRDEQRNNELKQGDLFEWIGCNAGYNPVIFAYNRLVSLRDGTMWDDCGVGMLKYIEDLISDESLRRLPPGYKVTLEQE